LVDDFIGRRDYIGARQTIETNLIPHIAKLKLASRVIPVRSQYAVVLAYCGDFAAADQEMARLAPYEEGMDERGKWELQNQRRMIDRMRRAAPPPQWQPFLSNKKPRVNDPCPCGSGKKYKKCHGQR
jgi:SEC-C motif-containing protein